MHRQQSKAGRNVLLKQCPRCNGDISKSSDEYGKYIHCLQCGYMADIKDTRSVEALRISVNPRRVA